MVLSMAHACNILATIPDENLGVKA